jgi:hypothetical protein
VVGGDVGGGNGGTHKWVRRLLQMSVLARRTAAPHSSTVEGVQHYVIKFVSDLRQISDFLRVLRFPPQIELTASI